MDEERALMNEALAFAAAKPIKVVEIRNLNNMQVHIGSVENVVAGVIVVVVEELIHDSKVAR